MCVHPCVLPRPPVYARAHVSQVQGDHRAQIHRHHIQVRPWPLPDCPGEEGIHGELENSTFCSVELHTADSFCITSKLTCGQPAGAAEEGWPEKSDRASDRGGLRDILNPHTAIKHISTLCVIVSCQLKLLLPN